MWLRRLNLGFISGDHRDDDKASHAAEPAFLSLHAACVAVPVFALRATTGLLPARRSSREGGSARQIWRRAAEAYRAIRLSRTALEMPADQATQRAGSGSRQGVSPRQCPDAPHRSARGLLPCRLPEPALGRRSKP